MHAPSIGQSRLEDVRAKYLGSDTAKGYDRSRFGGLAARLNQRALSRALKKALVGVPAQGRILDIPCGTGRLSWPLAREGYCVLAADVSPSMLAVARAKQHGGCSLGRPEFALADASDLPYHPNEFDAVVCVRFMNLLGRQDRIAVVRNLSKVAPTLIVAYYHPYTLKRLSRAVRRRLRITDAPLKERLTSKQLIEEIAETGCEVRTIIPVAPLFSEEWLVVLEQPSKR